MSLNSILQLPYEIPSETYTRIQDPQKPHNLTDSVISEVTSYVFNNVIADPTLGLSELIKTLSQTNEFGPEVTNNPKNCLKIILPNLLHRYKGLRGGFATHELALESFKIIKTLLKIEKEPSKELMSQIIIDLAKNHLPQQYCGIIEKNIDSLCHYIYQPEDSKDIFIEKIERAFSLLKRLNIDIKDKINIEAGNVNEYDFCFKIIELQVSERISIDLGPELNRVQTSFLAFEKLLSIYTETIETLTNNPNDIQSQKDFLEKWNILSKLFFSFRDTPEFLKLAKIANLIKNNSLENIVLILKQ